MSMKILIPAKKVSLILLLTAAFFLSGCTQKSAEDEAYKKGLSHLEKQEYSAALQEFKNSINTNHSNTDAYVKSAEILKKKADLDGAISVLQNGKDFASEPDLIYQGLGEVFLLKNDAIQAEENFKKAVEFDRENAVAAEGLSKSLVLQNRYEEGEKILSDFNNNELDSKVRIKYLLAVLQSKDFDKAKETIDALKVNLEDYSQLKKLSTALDEAKTSEDNKIEDFMNISYVIIDGGDYAYALPLLQDVIAENEYYYGGQMYSGYVYLKLGQLDKSKEFLQKAVNLDSKNTDILKFLAQCYVEMNNQKEATDTYDTLVSLASTDGEIRKEYVEALLKFEIADKAKEQGLALVGIDPSINSRLLLTEILIDLEDFKGASDQIRLASDSEEYKTAEDSVKADVLSYKGWALYKTGEKSPGLELLEQSLRLVETNPETHLYLGKVSKETEEPVDAKKYFERSIDLDFSGKVSKEARIELNSLM